MYDIDFQCGTISIAILFPHSLTSSLDPVMSVTTRSLIAISYGLVFYKIIFSPWLFTKFKLSGDIFVRPSTVGGGLSSVCCCTVPVQLYASEPGEDVPG